MREVFYLRDVFRMIWFKNILTYRFSRPIDINPELIEKQLSEVPYTPCNSQDKQKFGWSSALGKHSDMMSHVVDGNILICAHKEEKMLPASVIKQNVATKIEQAEKEQGKPLKKKEKETIKEDVIMELLPRAFSRHNHTFALIMPKLELIIVDAGSAKKAEDLLALLRKTIGSLPVVPVETKKKAELAMTEWVLSNNAPAGFTIGEEAELKAILEQGGIIRCKQQDLNCDEIFTHIEADKLVTKLALNWRERVDMILCDDLSLKRLKFSDEITAQNEDIDKEDIISRIDADLVLMCCEFTELLPEVFDALDDIYKE